MGETRRGSLGRVYVVSVVKSGLCWSIDIIKMEYKICGFDVRNEVGNASDFFYS